jgi:protein-arginine deiminase
VVNGLVLTGTGDNDSTHIVAPNPWGPLVDGGKDMWAESTRAAYARAGAGLNINFMDDYFSHHVGVGEVHCGTNSLRSPDTPWW